MADENPDHLRDALRALETDPDAPDQAHATVVGRARARRTRRRVLSGTAAAALVAVVAVAAVAITGDDAGRSVEVGPAGPSPTTVPPSTVPPTTVPPSTVPPTTVPPTTVPPSTVPPPPRPSPPSGPVTPWLAGAAAGELVAGALDALAAGGGHGSPGALASALQAELERGDHEGGDRPFLDPPVPFDDPPTLQVSQRGFADDSLAGLDHRLTLEERGDGWHVAAVEHRWLCRRGVSGDVCL